MLKALEKSSENPIAILALQVAAQVGVATAAAHPRRHLQAVAEARAAAAPLPAGNTFSLAQKVPGPVWASGLNRAWHFLARVSGDGISCRW